MKNINVNLTKEQAKFVDETTKKYGYANRSEFMRSLLRFVSMYSPGILNKLDSITFEEPLTKDVDEITGELKKTGKYNKQFVESVTAGLKKSEYFIQK